MPTDMYNDAVCTSDFFIHCFQLTQVTMKNLQRLYSKKKQNWKSFMVSFYHVYTFLCVEIWVVSVQTSRGDTKIFSADQNHLHVFRATWLFPFWLTLSTLRWPQGILLTDFRCIPATNWNWARKEGSRRTTTWSTKRWWGQHTYFLLGPDTRCNIASNIARNGWIAPF